MPVFYERKLERNKMSNTIFMAVLFLLACSTLMQVQCGSCQAEESIFFKKLADIDAKSEELKAYPETVRQGIDFLKSNDLSKLPMGRLDIDGDKVYLMKQEYETRSASKVVIESHKKYIDIQLILKGKEQMACVSFKESFPVKEAYSAEKDVMFFPNEVMPFWQSGAQVPNRVLATEGWFAIFTPNDLHASGIYPEKSEKIQKIVVKCLVENR